MKLKLITITTGNTTYRAVSNDVFHWKTGRIRFVLTDKRLTQVFATLNCVTFSQIYRDNEKKTYTLLLQVDEDTKIEVKDFKLQAQ